MSEWSNKKSEIYRSLDAIPANFGPSVVAIGNFDGVHRGHQAILAALLQDARLRGARAIAITFDPHPEKFLHPGNAPMLLTPMDERLRLLSKTGLDAALVLRFDEELAHMPARIFVHRVLKGALRAKAVHEGENFRFGFRAEAGIDELAAFGQEMGFTVSVHKPVQVHRMEVSSSAVRRLVSQGKMQQARWMLGRPFAIVSQLARGRGVGTKLLFPTLNLAKYDGLLPAQGVYATFLSVNGCCFEAVTNVGVRPTFDGAGFSVETHILNFEPIEMNDQTEVEVAFHRRLRAEQKWSSPEALKAQIAKDIAQARRYFRLASVCGVTGDKVE